MSKHIVIIVALMLVAAAGYALPLTLPGATYATEEELLASPGSAGYPVGDDADVVKDALESPVCDCESDEGEDGFEDGAEPAPGDGDADGGDEDSAPEGDEDDTEGGC